MFYPNNTYMQDLYAYNQMPNDFYNPYLGMQAVNSQPLGYQNMGINQNQNMYNQNPNNLYPSIYKIITPVINRVIAGTNLPYLTENNLNNMVDTVYNIVEGQIEFEEQIEEIHNNEDLNKPIASTQTNSNIQNSRNPNELRNSSSNNNLSNSTNVNNAVSPTKRSSSRDYLLRDLIKILILKQIFSRNCNNLMPFNYQNQFGLY